ncbi:hypothetical protein [Glycomyces harbinensis]|uniref:Uncharacterized protein n=1 Tax=Glycomyces harbinensis TaxID=58114 RepID=A0A1G7A2D7_9ACTN|nr:hypothetical protein [Glycomyces harbinensis]SDE09064.1 hypothetical protein SAMN05216270_112112 [Glycomyces harbinensis]
MFPSELLPIAAFMLLATPIALTSRAWFLHRTAVARERARTERMQQALASTTPAERAAILRALHGLEAGASGPTDDER